MQTLLGYLEAGETIDDFVEGFQSVSREHVIALLGGGEGPSDRSSGVKVFLDECVDRRLGRDMVGHDVKTAREMGWTGMKNGELLALAAEQFDVFVTVDQNLSFRQNLAVLPIAVVVLRATTNRLADLRRLMPRLLAALGSSSPRAVMFIDAG